MEAGRKRIDKIEGSLTPMEIVALWVQDIRKFDSTQAYASWAVDNLLGLPLGKMLQQVKDGMPKLSGNQQEYEFRKLFRRRASEVVFLYHLVHKANQHIADFVDSERLRSAAITASVQALNECVCSAVTMFEVWKTLIDSPYPLDTDTAAAVLAVIENDVTSVDDLLDHRLCKEASVI